MENIGYPNGLLSPDRCQIHSNTAGSQTIQKFMLIWWVVFI